MAASAQTYSDYTVGWICASTIQLRAGMAMLDDLHASLPASSYDDNIYSLGSIGEHNVVIACRPIGQFGIRAAVVTTAAKMISTFPLIKFVLMVGIGGGVPPNVRLGDVVVGTPNGQFPCVVQWDDSILQTGSLIDTPPLLLTALSKIEAMHRLVGSRIPEYLERLRQDAPRLASRYLKSDSLQDMLFEANYSHVKFHDDDGEKEQAKCGFCDETMTIEREPRGMLVHYGLIASSHREVKNAAIRDELNREFGENILCIDTEVAGLTNNFPCLVIRGICDYADSHKNKDWQGHATIVAAAYAKELLQYVLPRDVDLEPRVKDRIGQIHYVAAYGDDLSLTKMKLRGEEDVQILEWLETVDYSSQHRNFLRKWQPETGLWLLDSAEYKTWLNTKSQTLFCPGDPGTGKTILTSAVINDVKMRFPTNLSVGIAYIYCDSLRQEAQKIEELIADLLKQLCQRQTSISTCVKEIYIRHKYNRTRPSLDELLESLHEVVQTYSRVFIIVDALDECQTSSGCRQIFLEELFNLQKQFGANCFTTSRPILEILTHFKTCAISMELPTNTSDIVIYVNSYLEQLPEFIELNLQLQETILTKILENIDGRFLSATIFLRLLKEKLTESSIMEALEDIVKPNLELDGEKERSKPSQKISPTSAEEVEVELEEPEKLNPQPSKGDKVKTLALGEQFSDSGYASMPRDQIRKTGILQNEAASQESCNKLAELGPNINSLLEESVSVSIEETDDRTEYSAATSLSDSRIEGLVSQLADQLIGEAYLDGLDERSMETVFSVLQDSLKIFALKVGLNAQSQVQRDIMYYTHKYSRNIAHLFETRLNDRDRDRDNFGARIPPDISQEMTRDWLDNLGDPGEFESHKIPDNQDMEQEDQDYEEDGEASVSDLGAYRDLIIGSPAFGWLLAVLRRESLVEVECSHSMEDIKQKILSSLKSDHKISRSRSAEAFRATFLINWDPITFFKEQGYQGSLEEVIDRVITLTGSAKNAQALTTLQYLHQIWPTTGEHVLQLVKDVLSGPRGQKHAGHLPEGTELTAWFTGIEFITEVSGTRASIAEIGEQLAWLSASLCSPLYDTGITSYTPSVHIVQRDDAKLRVPNQDIHYRIERTGQKELTKSSNNGQCWHNMFRNPVLVEGFPVLRRPKLDTGLEMPLNMMSALANTQRIDEFNGKIFIKGFSTMLIPTDYIEGVIIWHLQYRKDGDHISYFDACVPHISMNASDIEQSRNIVGWCSQADLFAGATEAKYNVQRSGLPRPTADCVLHNISISAGKYITGGVNFAMGIKDQPIHLTRGSYTPKLEWIHKKFVVLWDERYKRGWLVNGTTALLHLSRAALKRKQESPFKSLLLFKSGSLEEATERFTAESAVQVLTNERNMKLKIYRDKSQHNERVFWRGTDRERVVYEEENFYRFQDLVDDLYNILEKMVEYQNYVSNRDGVSLKCRIRKHLDGWEFDDIIENQDCRPSVATLEAMGYGWVNLITEIGAVTLLGKDFGNIIQPSSATMLCDRWSQVPKDRYYLGACVSDLANIIRSHGEEGADQLRLTNNISWHSPDKPFEPCRCHSATPSKHSHLVQELRKSEDYRGLGSSSSKICYSASPDSRGAVIFSHNYQLVLKRDDAGTPTKSKLPLLPETSNGIDDFGPSRIQMPVEGNNSSWSLNSGQLTPVMGSATSEQCDSHPGLFGSQTEASIDDSLATSISKVQGHTVSISQDSSKVMGEAPPDNHASFVQDTVASSSQENDSTDLRQRNSRRGRWKNFKQRFSNFSRK